MESNENCSAISALLVEDDRDLAANVVDFLALGDIDCDYCDRAETALNLVWENEYQVLILDVQLPGINGFRLCQTLRERGITVPILMLTARDTVPDKLEGFGAGADDYLVKPFDLRELEARIKVLQRRPASGRQSHVLQVGNLVMDTATYEVTRGRAPLKLTRAGWTLLRELMEQSPKVVTRDRLEFILWPDSSGNSESLKSHIYSLRKAVDAGQTEKLIHTVRNIGLCLKPEHPSHD